jgi:hypothetical protein
MFRSTALLALILSLAGCAVPRPSAPPVARPLERSFVACRTQDNVAALHAAGAGFQREVDNRMADGRCRRFEQGHRVLNRTNASFVDPGNGARYWIYHW